MQNSRKRVVLCSEKPAAACFSTTGSVQPINLNRCKLQIAAKVLWSQRPYQIWRQLWNWQSLLWWHSEQQWRRATGYRWKGRRAPSQLSPQGLIGRWMSGSLASLFDLGSLSCPLSSLWCFACSKTKLLRFCRILTLERLKSDIYIWKPHRGCRFLAGTVDFLGNETTKI